MIVEDFLEWNNQHSLSVLHQRVQCERANLTREPMTKTLYYLIGMHCRRRGWWLPARRRDQSVCVLDNACTKK